MPRNHQPGASTLRNRIRITNKTRLKIHSGNLEADALLFPDEDEEKHHFTNLVAGVDAEDAQEHHLQAVLSASQRPQFQPRPSRTGEKPQDSQPAAYIPTPDSTGIVDNYDELYQSERWKDHVNYLCSSSTVEDLCRDGLAEGFNYYMDERDKEWLEKNNEEARGEGTSAQGAVSASSIRTSGRSAKAKGKDPEVSQPLVISDDEFELVMGLFEKVTHEKTEYLHHGLENGMAFPAFSEYQEFFSSSIPTPTFASFTAPSWLPQPSQLLRIARTVYPYWRERRLERGGHRIIPTLNFDESDALNESYVCFRRREIKSVRKTRASQASSSDKLLRLQHELQYPLDLAKAILSRENNKRECLQQAQQIWEQRMALSDLKRKYPSLNDKSDEELLLDKEKPKKVEAPRPTKIRAEPGPSVRPEVALRPTERTARIKEAIDAALNQRKEQDHQWEDQIDNPYQVPLVPYPSRLFRYIPVNFTPAESDGKPVLQRQPRALRLRCGRGGRVLVDRRDTFPPPIRPVKRSRLFDNFDSDVDMEGPDDELTRKIGERWRFDVDDMPALGPGGPEEHHRILVDDYAEKYLRHSMTLLLDVDQQSLVTDPSIPAIIDGRPQTVIPFRLGMPPAVRPRPMPPPQAMPPGTVTVPSISCAQPIAAQQQLNKISSPAMMRISSGGGMRPPSALSSTGSTLQSSPPAVTTLPPHPAPTSNGISRAAINISHVDISKPEIIPSHSAMNGVAQPHATETSAQQVNGINGSPMKQNVLHHPALNSYSIAQLAAQNPNAAALAQFALQGAGVLNPQQMQTLKNAITASGQDFTALQNVARNLPLGYVTSGTNFNLQQLAAGPNMNIKLPATRQMQQWVTGTAATAPKPASGTNGVATSAVDVAAPSTPSPGQTVPVRVPSANGTRTNGIRIPSSAQLNAHPISPHLNHVPPATLSTSSSLTQAQSPPRLPSTPTPTKASPSLQQSQLSNSKSGY